MIQDNGLGLVTDWNLGEGENCSGFHQGQLANFTLYNVDVINCPLTSWASSHNKNVGGLLGKAHAGTAGQDSVSYQGISSFSASKPQRVLSIPHGKSYSFCLFGRKVPTKVETLAVPLDREASM